MKKHLNIVSVLTAGLSVLASCGGEPSLQSQSAPLTAQSISIPVYGTVDLGPMPARLISVDVNDSGRVTGTYSNSTAFVTGGVGANMVTLSGMRSANSINDQGDLVGSRFSSNVSVPLLRKSDGTMTDLLWPGHANAPCEGVGSCADALSINEWGQAAGNFYTPSAPGRLPFSNGFIYSQGRFINVTGLAYDDRSAVRAINNRGHVTGEASLWSHPLSGDFPTSAFIFRNGVAEELVEPTHYQAQGLALNDLDEVVGTFRQFGPVGNYAFFWSNGKATDLRTLAPQGFSQTSVSEAYDINNHSQIVGLSSDTSNVVGFLWRDGGMIDLNVLAERPTQSIEKGLAISDSGYIVASEFVGGQTHLVLMVPGQETTARAIAGFDGTTGTGTGSSTEILDGTLSKSTAPGASIVSCEWDFGDGTPPSNECRVEHTFTTVGYHHPVLRVVDSTGATGRAFLPVKVNPNPPPGTHDAAPEADTAVAVARFDGSDGTGTIPSTQYFDGTLSHSTTPGAWIVSCQWSFGDASENSDSCWTEHTYTVRGKFTASLRVVDSNGATHIAILPVNLAGGLHARAVRDGSTEEGSAPSTQYFDATTSSTDDKPNGWIQSFEWDFGDGSPVSHAGWVEHVYQQPGKYIATLKVTDSRGRTSYDFLYTTVH